MRKLNVLVLCPHPKGKGGVAYYNRLIEQNFVSDSVLLDFYYTGKSYENNIKRIRIVKIIHDLFVLLKIIRQYDLVILNPSLDFKAMIRDGIFHTIAKRIFQKKTLVFFHGWKTDFEQLIDKYGKIIFNFVFDFDKACVLSSRFRTKLIGWGKAPDTIILETTNFQYEPCEIQKDRFNVVFLSRFATGKGPFETIKTIEILRDEFPDLKLYMVGDGELNHSLRDYVGKKNLTDIVQFTGWLTGYPKYKVLEQCGMMLLPSHSEGMPISLLEGMACGLVIVTRPVGGIPAIIVDGKNGFLIESLNPDDFSDKIRWCLNNKAIWEKISNRNRREANEKFEIKNVVQRLEKLYFEIGMKV